MALSQPTSASITYARALLELANEQSQAEEIGQQLKAIREILHEQPAFAEFLADPAIGRETRTAALDRLFKGRISPLLFNFIGVVNHNRRLGLFAQICDAFDDLLEEQLGHVEVDITVAQRLDADSLERVRQRIGTALHRTAVVHQYVDDSIIGGMKLRVRDQLIDASVRYQLEAMKHRLVASSPK